MSIIASKPKKEYSPAPEGLHAAVCCDVVDLGILKSAFGEKHKVEIRWMLEENDPKTELPFMVVSRYTLSLHEKAKLRPMLEGWRGRNFSVEELEGFDLENLLGVNCQLQIIHNIADEGQVYANVQAVIPPAKGATKLRVNAKYVRVAERERRDYYQAHPDGEPFQATDDMVPF